MFCDVLLCAAALNRLKGRRRLWCVLDESRGQLLYHKSEEEARCKPPMGHVELRGAAISLDLDNQNQFVIMSVPVPLSLSHTNKHLSAAVVHSGGGLGWGPA